MPGIPTQHARRPIIVIGCDDGGSAIACVLHRAGVPVVIVDGADPPWARRGMSYTDAWYAGGASLDGVDACFCGSVKSVPAIVERGELVAATTWSWEGVAAAVHPIAIIETRARPVTSAAECRPAALADVLVIGVGATHVGSIRADVVVADGRASAAWRGDAVDRERSLVRIDAPDAGRFRTRHEIAERVDAGDVIGDLGSFTVIAPVSGVLRGLAARGARVAPGQPLVEIDRTGDAARCFGIASEARALAHRVAAVVRRRGDGSTAAARRRPADPLRMNGASRHPRSACGSMDAGIDA